jgi:putative phosphoribosyl transferase
VFREANDGGGQKPSSVSGLETLDRAASDATIPIEGAELEATLAVRERAAGVVVFAHGSGSGRHSPRNRYVADHLVQAGFGTLLVDLLTQTEERYDRETAELRFDIDLLASRLVLATDWLARDDRVGALPIGLFGASTGAAAALIAAVERAERVAAVVSRGGRPDLAKGALEKVTAPTLLIVGERDREVLDLNTEAAERMPHPATIEVVARAGHLFEEEGALERVAELTTDWFVAHLQR